MSACSDIYYSRKAFLSPRRETNLLASEMAARGLINHLAKRTRKGRTIKIRMCVDLELQTCGIRSWLLCPPESVGNLNVSKVLTCFGLGAGLGVIIGLG